MIGSEKGADEVGRGDWIAACRQRQIDRPVAGRVNAQREQQTHGTTPLGHDLEVSIGPARGAFPRLGP